MPPTRVLVWSSGDCVQRRIESRRRRKMVGPVAVPSRHSLLQSARFGAAVRRFQGVEVGGLNEDFDVRRLGEETLEEPTSDLRGDLVIGHAWDERMSEG